jgi:DNA (cytosine-5)-methyltransferase 1
MTQRPIAIDLFAGAGGLSLGFEQAGFDVVAAVELDPIHACVHQFNFPHCPVLVKSVREISGKEIRQAAGLTQAKDIDVLMGGAPCQGFSMMGQRALEDPRNSLVNEFIRLVKELQPKYFVFENVKGLTLGKHRSFLDEIVQASDAMQYQILHPWQVLNAKNYGVPQSRERLFLIGARQALPLPVYPAPHPGYVTCGEALGDLPDAEQFDVLNHSDQVQADYLAPPVGYQGLMRCATPAAWQFGYPRHWHSHYLTASQRTNHSPLSRQRFRETPPGTVEPISRFFRLSETGIAHTLRAGTDSARGAFTSPRPIHYGYDRCVTVREMARLQGFPDWFRFQVTKWHGARQIGNSVPPPLARAIANQIIKVLGSPKVRPTTLLTLGDPQLVHFDMTNASRYWGIPTPIAQRNRKSSQVA